MNVDRPISSTKIEKLAFTCCRVKTILVTRNAAGIIVPKAFPIPTTDKINRNVVAYSITCNISIVNLVKLLKKKRIQAIIRKFYSEHDTFKAIAEYFFLSFSRRNTSKLMLFFMILYFPVSRNIKGYFMSNVLVFLEIDFLCR
jgi:hypothetical protein